EQVHVKYGNTPILENINWIIHKGEKWALLGPNGAGKSTLLSLLSGDNPQAYANTIYLFDKKRGSGESIWDIKSKIGFVSPELHVYFRSNSSCLDVILSGYSDTMNVNHKKITKEQIGHAIDWMQLLDIEYLKDQKFKQLPAGKQRLVLLLRALVKDPSLLILDEPCQGLDEEQKSHFKNILETACGDPERSLIYVTHYLDEIPDIVNHVLHLTKGQVVEEG
ncbi:MAG: ABC transporter ATP-binding protein, partial [Chitinophagaceae bacterium]